MSRIDELSRIVDKCLNLIMQLDEQQFETVQLLENKHYELKELIGEVFDALKAFKWLVEDQENRITKIEKFLNSDDYTAPPEYKQGN